MVPASRWTRSFSPLVRRGKVPITSRLTSRLLAVGSDPADDADLRLRKFLVLVASATVLPAAALWGAIYWAFGEPTSALVPWSYVLVTGVSLPLFSRTRRYEWYASIQVATFLVLPFLLMWSLGGFVTGSMVALWAWLSPLAAHTIGHRRASLVLFSLFGIGFALRAVIQPVLDAETNLTDFMILALFVLNVVVVGAISLVFVDASAGGREGSLASMRNVVRRYFSPDVANAILTDPERQELGGEVADVTILFADLGGYTTFSDKRSPHEVVELLNTLFAVALPAIHDEGGTPVQLPGDAVMAIFGAPRHAPDHASRAARAALAIGERVSDLAADHPSWPRFRIGLNSGDALVGNIGTDEFRNFTAIGDTVNMAQRFQTLAQPGQVVTGSRTAEQLDPSFEKEWMDEVTVKGKLDPIRPCVLRGPTRG
jgi:class 3 adenylate cyclase